MIGDIAAKVIVQYQADTDDMKKKLRELQGEERKLAEEQLKQANARNAQLENLANGITIVQKTFQAFGAVAKFLWDDWKQRAEESRLKTAAFGVQLDLLSKAALGTRTQMALLADAAAMNNGIFKLTSQEMAMVEKAMLGLIRKGHDQAEVHKKVLDAVTQLKTDGLRDFGVMIDKAGLSMETYDGRLGIFRNTLDGLTKASLGVADSQRTMAEEAERAGARISDSWKKFKRDWITGPANIGGIEVSMGSYVADGEYQRKVTRAILEQAAAAQAAGKSLDQYAADMQKAIAAQATMAQVLGVLKQRYGYRSSVADDLLASTAAIKAGTRRSGGASGPAYDSDPYAYRRSYALADRPGFNASDVFGGYSDIGIGISDARLAVTDRAGTDAAYGRYTDKKLEGIFGPLTDFDAYATAFQTLNGAVGSAFGAWIDGSMSAGKAFKALIGEALKGVATQMAMEAIKHGAYALGSLAFGNLAGAATHGKAAAAFAAGAVVVGAAAKSLHSGGGSSASAPGGGVPAYSGGPQQQQSTTTVVAFGQDFTEENTARQRALRAARALEAAKQYGGNGAVSYP